MKQKRHVVAADVQVAPVNVGDVRKRIQILDRRPVGIVHDLAILAIGDAEDLIDRLAVGVFDDGIVEFLAADHVDDFGFIKRLFREGR